MQPCAGSGSNSRFLDGLDQPLGFEDFPSGTDVLFDGKEEARILPVSIEQILG